MSCFLNVAQKYKKGRFWFLNDIITLKPLLFCATDYWRKKTVTFMIKTASCNCCKFTVTIIYFIKWYNISNVLNFQKLLFNSKCTVNIQLVKQKATWWIRIHAQYIKHDQFSHMDTNIKMTLYNFSPFFFCKSYKHFYSNNLIKKMCIS